MDNLTIVIPFFNGHSTIHQLLDGIPSDLPVVVVDDHSERPFSSERPNVTVLRPPQKGYFSGAVNAGIRATRTDVLVLNQDVVLEGVAWADLLSVNRGKYGVIGDGVFNHPAWPLGYVQGTFMYMSREAINAVGGFRADEYPLWGSTCEWQLRICRKGFEALPLKSVPGFTHLRGEKRYGSAISSALATEPKNQRWFIQTPPKVSVIINCYNYGRYLTDAVHSLIGGPTSLGEHPGQSYGSFEVIIVNDASQDETREVGEHLATVNAWSGVRYVELPPANHPDGLPNNGTSAANNAGIRAAYGRNIAILCADDMMAEGRLEALLRAQEANPHSIIYDDIQEFANGTYTQKRQMAEYDFEKLLQRNSIHAGIMFPKQAWQEIGGYPEIMRYGREDWAVNVAFGQKGWCGVRVPEFGYLYRREGQGRSYRNTSPVWHEKFTEQLYSLFPGLYRGDRPMGCCGSKRTRSAASNQAGASRSANMEMLGQDGMEILEYTGGNAGTQQFVGPVSGKVYVFGGRRKRGYVDRRDVYPPTGKGLREIYGVFRVVAPEAVKPQEPDVAKKTAEFVNPVVEEPVTPVDAPAVELAADIVVEETAKAVVTPDINALTASEVQVLLEGDLTVEQLNTMLTAEQDGKNRKTVIASINGAIAAKSA